jgi:alanine racemase
MSGEAVMHQGRPTWAEIDLDAVAHNIRELQEALHGPARLMPVIKANAYGHGHIEVARVCLGQGIEDLGVAILEEALQLRESGINNARILILGYTQEEAVEQAISHDVRLTVYNYRGAEIISRAACESGQTAYIHLKIDTGMGRLGFTPDEKSLAVMEDIFRLPGIEVEGAFTHFASADAADQSYTEWQLSRFINFTGQLERKGFHIPLKHAANSAALLSMPASHLNLVRAGIAVYGLSPTDDESGSSPIHLIPAMRLLSRVVMLKELPPGQAVSYGCTYVTSRNTRVATVPIGYADGYTRLLSNKAWAVINGYRVPLIGRVCMDQCMFDVTGVPDVKEGDEVILFGRPEDGVTADDLAGILGTINYEIVCMIGARVPRIYR